MVEIVRLRTNNNEQDKSTAYYYTKRSVSEKKKGTVNKAMQSKLSLASWRPFWSKGEDSYFGYQTTPPPKKKEMDKIITLIAMISMNASIDTVVALESPSVS